MAKKPDNPPFGKNRQQDLNIHGRWWLTDRDLPEIIDKGVKEAKRWQTKPAQVVKSLKDSQKKQRLDEAIVAEAANLGKALASSIEFARELRPGVRERLKLPREGEGWPSEGTIKLAISDRIKPAKTNRVSPTSAKTNKVSR
jgi:hypothetical protein